jgi:ABC-type bacteriocin/lantibiotic exporter with double-glycine peptidase domain
MSKPVVTPTVLQMEATECGAASLGIILAYYDKYVLLEELRDECGVSRDGSKASSVLGAAKRYGLSGKGLSKTPEGVRDLKLPGIIHWNFNHFLVLEGFKNGKVYLNDPAAGRRTVNDDEFKGAFTGVILTLEPGPDFKPGGQKPNIISAIRRRIRGMESTLLFLLIASLALVIPGLVLPTMSRIFGTRSGSFESLNVSVR